MKQTTGYYDKQMIRNAVPTHPLKRIDECRDCGSRFEFFNGGVTLIKGDGCPYCTRMLPHAWIPATDQHLGSVRAANAHTPAG